MTKQIIGILLIVVGTIGLGNFITHHDTIPLNDDNSHMLIGLLIIVTGIVLIKSKSKILNHWTQFKNE